MKAAQWDPHQKKIVVNELPIPEPGENQFLVKMSSASLCHSDLMAIATPDLTKPVTLGHEGVGHITKFHPSAKGKGFKEGEAVGFLYIIGCCFECEGCQIHNLACKTGKQLLQGFSTDGFFAEYAVVDYHNAVVLPSSMDMKTSAPIFCAGITAFHSVDSSELKPGDWFGVIGCGGLGQLATQYAKAMGYNVVGIDINDSVLAQCKAQGADAIFNSMTNKTYVEELKKLTDGGVRAVAVFSNADAAYAGAPPIIRNGGVLMVVGLPKNPLQISSMDLVLGRYKIKGESTSIPQRMKKAVEFTAKHNIHPEVDLRPGLRSVQDMVTEMQKGQSAKRMTVVF
ncbi:alcohol dehydrogenase [Amylocarpus encephaloides]|uniref:Alcohol dehydrogenase n=1 Tax=Amylocarpus encephaloides TaxID=45428 RepID=A0A9P7YKQ1_9HELO|nr:alcohol dehydrogenase [Amylocarpus encephaloides]